MAQGDSLYIVRDWDKHFEKAQTRRVDKAQWVPLPLKHDGKGYRRVMRAPNGPAIYAAWVLMLQVAAKCPIRGVLADEDGPLTAEDLEMKTDCPAELFKAAFDLLCRPEIGWLTLECDGSCNPLLSNSDPGDASLQLQDRTGQDITEQEESPIGDSCGEQSQTTDSPPAMTEFVFPVVGTGRKTWTLSQAKLNQYLASFPGVDVLAQMRLAMQWCRDNPTKRKTVTGMPSFLTRWLGRAQNAGGGARAGPAGDASDVLSERERRLQHRRNRT